MIKERERRCLGMHADYWLTREKKNQKEFTASREFPRYG